jgi:hypothetical protein
MEGLGYTCLSGVKVKYRSLHKWHIWLGWLIGIPLILWTASGLFMVARPIEEVRGEHLRSAPLMLTATAPVAPALGPRPVEKLTLEQRVSGPVWVIQYQGGDLRRADPATGAFLPKVSAPEAAALAASYYAGTSRQASVRQFAADKAPLDLRRERPSWQVSYADGTRLYVDAETGALLALRTGQWRLYDVMWGLHIMDLQTREDSHNPVLILFAALAFLALLLAFWMQIARQRRHRKT